MAREIKLGLLGNGIGHSRAKSLHELIGELNRLNICYQPMDLAGRSHVDIAGELMRCREEDYRGVNVTRPYKCDAYRSVEVPPGFPPGLTSVNTVLFEAERQTGDNTDYSGFCRAYIDHFGTQQKPGRVLMLGAGGVGLAIAFALQKLGAAELVIYDQHPHSAHALAHSLNGASFAARVVERTDLVDAMRNADGLVNATPIGMFQYPGSPFPTAGFARQRWAFDAVYTPERTVFLNQCREREIEIISGFKLFLFQGLDAFRLFTGMIVEAEEVESAFLGRYPLRERAYA